MAMIAGYLIDLASVGDLQKDYTPSFYLVVIILSINALCVTKIKVGKNFRYSTFFVINLILSMSLIMKVDYHQEPYDFGKVVLLFRRVRIVMFLFSCITFGILIGTVWQFHLW